MGFLSRTCLPTYYYDYVMEWMDLITVMSRAPEYTGKAKNKSAHWIMYP